MFKKPEEPRPKTPTPYEEASERPAKVRKVSAKNPRKMMAVLKEKQSTSFLGEMVASLQLQPDLSVSFLNGLYRWMKAQFIPLGILFGS